ncbi:MAG: glycine oxidase ThiO [Marinicaulis sp.]|nr:glycine oxidase ThiO [Marinicaulis sp.]
MTARGYDIAIIGGGVIGLSIALRLADTRARICVIDAGQAQPGASDAAAGMLAPSFEKGGEELYQLSAASLALWPSFASEVEAQSGDDIDYRDDGILGVALSDAQSAALKGVHDRLAMAGAKVEMLDGAAARSLEPGLSETIDAAMFAANDAQVDAQKLKAALEKVVAKNVGPLLRETVEELGESFCPREIIFKSGKKIFADKVILASGAAAAMLPAGSPAPPIQPVKGEALSVKMTRGAFQHVVRGPGAYICPKAGDRMIIGATEISGRDDLGVDDVAIDALRKNAASFAPGVSGYRELERWAGLRPGTPDGAPILGADIRGPDDIILALGHYRNGILLAPKTADLIAALIEQNAATSGEISPFRPDRFGRNQDQTVHG